MNRRIVFVVGAAALLVIGGVIVAAQSGAPRTDAGARTPLSSAQPTATAPTAGSSTAPDEPGTSAPVEPAPDGLAPGDPAAMPDTGSGDVGTRYSTEVLPPADPPTTSLPPSKSPPVLVTLPLPASKSADGGLVDGFPSAVIGAAPGSTIAASSVSAEGDRLHVALTARSTLTGAEVLGHYRTAFAALGLYDVAAPAAVGSSALAFTRGENSITLTVTERAGGGCHYEIFAALTAAS